MKSLTDELDGKLCIDVHDYVCMYVCMYVCLYILTVCSPVNSMNGSPSLNITGLCKLEMVVILKNMTIYVHARENYMYMPGRTI